MVKKAFTLIEIVFVLIVLGIIASIGSEVLVKIYEHRMLAQATLDASYKTQAALETIAKRLSYRIPDSEVVRKTTDSNDVLPLTSVNPTYDILEWIGQAYEAYRGRYNGTRYVPGYSGFVDLNSSGTTKAKIDTPGSRLDYAADIIYILNGIDLNSSNNGIGLIFRGGVQNGNPLRAFNWDYQGTADEVYTVYRQGQTTLHFDDTSSKKDIIEQYYLSYSAYAIVPEKNSEGDYNLTLYYNYKPWLGEKYNDGEKALLVSHISRFKYQKIDQAIELALCAIARVTSDYNVTFCSKKVVF